MTAGYICDDTTVPVIGCCPEAIGPAIRHMHAACTHWPGISLVGSTPVKDADLCRRYYLGLVECRIESGGAVGTESYVWQMNDNSGLFHPIPPWTMTDHRISPEVPSGAYGHCEAWRWWDPAISWTATLGTDGLHRYAKWSWEHREDTFGEIKITGIIENGWNLDYYIQNVRELLDLVNTGMTIRDGLLGRSNRFSISYVNDWNLITHIFGNGSAPLSMYPSRCAFGPYPTNPPAFGSVGLISNINALQWVKGSVKHTGNFCNHVYPDVQLRCNHVPSYTEGVLVPIGPIDDSLIYESLPCIDESAVTCEDSSVSGPMKNEIRDYLPDIYGAIPTHKYEIFDSEVDRDFQHQFVLHNGVRDWWGCTGCSGSGWGGLAP